MPATSPRGSPLDPPDLLTVVDAAGAALIHAGKTTLFGVTPPPQLIEILAGWLLSRGEQGVFASERLASQVPSAASYAEVAAGLLAVPLDRQGESHLLWFRPGVE